MPENAIQSADEGGIQRCPKIGPVDKPLTGGDRLRPIVVVLLVHDGKVKARAVGQLDHIDLSQQAGKGDNGQENGEIRPPRAGGRCAARCHVDVLRFLSSWFQCPHHDGWRSAVRRSCHPARTGVQRRGGRVTVVEPARTALYFQTGLANKSLRGCDHHFEDVDVGTGDVTRSNRLIPFYRGRFPAAINPTDAGTRKCSHVITRARMHAKGLHRRWRSGVTSGEQEKGVAYVHAHRRWQV